MERRAYLRQVTQGMWGSQATRLIQAELDSHLQACAEDLIAGGWSIDAAEAEAQRQLGDPRLLASAWRRTSWAQWLNIEAGIGLVVGILTGSEPWWTGSMGPWQANLMTGGGLLLALVGLGLSVHQWKQQAWTATQFSAWELISGFWLGAIATSVVIDVGNPLAPPGFVDWYGWGYIGHMVTAGSLLTGLASILAIGSRWQLTHVQKKVGDNHVSQ